MPDLESCAPSLPSVSRRRFLQLAGTASVLTVLPLTIKVPKEYPLLVVVLLRGGCDGMAMLCPRDHPTRRIRQGGRARDLVVRDTAGSALLFHPAAADLYEKHLEGRLLAAVGVGPSAAPRSHAEALDMFERGVANPRDAHPRTTWIERYVGVEKVGRLADRREIGGAVEASFQRAADAIASSASGSLLLLDFPGWDTHERHGERFSSLCGQLCKGLRELGRAAREEGRRTCVMVLSECGRRVAMDDAGGTELGVATTAFVLCENTGNGRVIGEWREHGPQRGGLATVIPHQCLIAAAMERWIDVEAAMRAFPNVGAAARQAVLGAAVTRM